MSKLEARIAERKELGALLPTLEKNSEISREHAQRLLDRYEWLGQAIKCEQQLIRLRANKITCAQERIDALEAGIKRCPIRRAAPGNITMREHLTKLKKQVEADPMKWADEEEARLVADLSKIDKELES